MPYESDKQRKLMYAALSAKQGKGKKPTGKVKEVADSMTEEQLKDFTKKEARTSMARLLVANAVHKTAAGESKIMRQIEMVPEAGPVKKLLSKLGPEFLRAPSAGELGNTLLNVGVPSVFGGSVAAKNYASETDYIADKVREMVSKPTDLENLEDVQEILERQVKTPLMSGAHGVINAAAWHPAYLKSVGKDIIKAKGAEGKDMWVPFLKAVGTGSMSTIIPAVQGTEHLLDYGKERGEDIAESTREAAKGIKSVSDRLQVPGNPNAKPGDPDFVPDASDIAKNLYDLTEPGSFKKFLFGTGEKLKDPATGEDTDKIDKGIVGELTAQADEKWEDIKKSTAARLKDPKTLMVGGAGIAGLISAYAVYKALDNRAKKKRAQEQAAIIAEAIKQSDKDKAPEENASQ